MELYKQRCKKYSTPAKGDQLSVTPTALHCRPTKHMDRSPDNTTETAAGYGLGSTPTTPYNHIEPKSPCSRDNRQMAAHKTDYVTDHLNQHVHLNHNKTYSTTVTYTNTNNNYIEIESQNANSQMSSITELFKEMKKLITLCDVKSMLKLLKNLNNKLENCSSHYEGYQASIFYMVQNGESP